MVIKIYNRYENDSLKSPVITMKSKLHIEPPQVKGVMMSLHGRGRCDPSIMGSTSMDPKKPLKPPTKKRPPSEFSTPARCNRKAPAAHLKKKKKVEKLSS